MNENVAYKFYVKQKNDKNRCKKLRICSKFVNSTKFGRGFLGGGPVEKSVESVNNFLNMY